MGKLEKIVSRIKQNPKNVRFDNLKNALLNFGCSVKQPRGGSSHYKFFHRAIPNFVLIIPRKNPVNVVYVKLALELIDLIKEELSDEN